MKLPNWKHHMGSVLTSATKLMCEDKIEILQKGRALSMDEITTMRGPYRLKTKNDKS